MTPQDAAARLARLENEIGFVQDRREIRRLQYLYGYYVDNHMWHDMVDLFCDDAPSIEIGERGNYVGKDRLRTLLVDVLGKGRWGLRRNELANHMQAQMVITVAADRQTAKMRSRAIIQVTAAPDAAGGLKQRWSENPYENLYVREGGVWKIKRLWATPIIYFLVPGTEDGHLHDFGPSETLPPDTPSHPIDSRLGRGFPPYHMTHPITGRPVLSPAEGTAGSPS
jgi:hypothetical protein